MGIYLKRKTLTPTLHPESFLRCSCLIVNKTIEIQHKISIKECDFDVWKERVTCPLQNGYMSPVHTRKISETMKFCGT